MVDCTPGRHALVFLLSVCKSSKVSPYGTCNQWLTGLVSLTTAREWSPASNLVTAVYITMWNLKFLCVAVQWAIDGTELNRIKSGFLLASLLHMHQLSDDLHAQVPVMFWDQNVSVKNICSYLGMKKLLVYRILTQYQDLGQPKPALHVQGHPSVLNETNIHFLSSLIDLHPCLYLDEIQAKLEKSHRIDVLIPTLIWALWKLDISQKTVSACTWVQWFWTITLHVAYCSVGPKARYACIHWWDCM